MVNAAHLKASSQTGKTPGKNHGKNHVAVGFESKKERRLGVVSNGF